MSDDLRMNEMTRPSSFADQVYGKILAAITSGQFPTQSRLPSEQKLGEMFGVSRPVVREALARLQRDGLVEIRKGSGSYVRLQPPDDLSVLANLDEVARYQRFQEFRLAVEAAAVALAAERRDEAAMARIQKAHDDFTMEVRGGEFRWQSDRALHLAIAEASGNEFFARSLEGSDFRLSDFMNLSLSLTRSRSPQRGALVIEEHANIVDAIRAKDPREARIAMEFHLSQSRRRMLDRTRSP